jgi:hypothetical protein
MLLDFAARQKYLRDGPRKLFDRTDIDSADGFIDSALPVS